MSAGHLALLTAGPLSTVQDAGRFGFRRFGVAQAGAFDPLYLAIANALVGNDANEAGIEFTLKGDKYRVEAEEALIGIAGDFRVSIDDAEVPSWRSYHLKRGQVLAVGGAKTDVRGVVAVAGGFDFPLILGSRSTHTRTGIGGPQGRALKAKDELVLKASAGPLLERVFDPAQLPARDGAVRVVLGPQEGHFSAQGMAAFLEGEFSVSPEADRMGYRLTGPEVQHARDYNLISEGIPVGAVQVPGSGQPIVLLNDCQTTGGYPKIAVVIEPDLRRFAQMKPGSTLRFAALERTAALAAIREHRALLVRVPELVKPVSR